MQSPQIGKTFKKTLSLVRTSNQLSLSALHIYCLSLIVFLHLRKHHKWRSSEERASSLCRCTCPPARRSTGAWCSWCAGGLWGRGRRRTRRRRTCRKCPSETRTQDRHRLKQNNHRDQEPFESFLASTGATSLKKWTKDQINSNWNIRMETLEVSTPKKLPSIPVSGHTHMSPGLYFGELGLRDSWLRLPSIYFKFTKPSFPANEKCVIRSRC